MRLLLLSRYTWAGNTSRHRSLKYVSYLADHGIDVTVAPLSDDAYVEALYSGKRPSLVALVRAYAARTATLLGAGRFDLIWIERELFPMAPAIAEALLDRTGVKYVVDYDDAIFHNYDMHSCRLVRGMLGRKIDRVMRHATMVIVGNSYLGNRARQAGARRIEELPTAVDTDLIPIQPVPENSRFTIGWIGSPPNARYLLALRGALETFTSDQRSRLVMVGGGDFDLPGVGLKLVPWIEDREAHDIGSFDVGIMPVPDEGFERGKCGFKILQYFAAGRPAIASPVGLNHEIISDGINGFLATTPAEWIEALEKLRDDPDLRHRMGLAGRQLVEERYSTAIIAPRLAELLRHAAGP